MFKKLLHVPVLSFCILHFAFCISAGAAPCAANRDTPELVPGNRTWLTQGSNVIYAGSIVCVDSNGLACAAADAAGYSVVGRAESYQDNTGANYLATRTLIVRRGVFRWGNGDTITDAQIGGLVYVTDDQTVQQGASSHNIIAGVVCKVETTGVWVDTHDIGAQGAITPASMAVSGTGTIGGNLGVTGNGTIGGTLGVTGNLTENGTITVRTNKFTVDASGNTVVAGTLNVTGAITGPGSGLTAIPPTALTGGSNVTITISSTLGTNVLYFSPGGTLTNATHNP